MVVGEDEQPNSVISSGYSSGVSSGNISPDISSTGTTSETSRFQIDEQFEERINRLRENVSSRSPSTVSSKCDSIPENIKCIARDLAYDIAHHVAGTKKQKPPSKHAETLRRTTEEMFTRHNIFFNGNIANISSDRSNACARFQHIADEMLSDGVCNWGRIVSLYCFGARLAQQCYQTSSDKNERIVTQIGEFVGNYVAEKLSSWINSNGGWVGRIAC